MSPNIQLPDHLVAKLSARCNWRGCIEDKADGSAFCAPHHEKQKGYQRKSAAKRRRSNRRCYDCGRRLSRRGRCVNCQQAQADSAKSRRVKDAARRVQNTVPARGRVVHEDRSREGWAPTARYVGRSRRGAPSLEDRARDGRIDLAEGRRLYEAFAAKYETAIAAGVFQMPKVQRDQALRLVAELGARACRVLSSIVLALDPDAETVAAEDK